MYAKISMQNDWTSSETKYKVKIEQAVTAIVTNATILSHFAALSEIQLQWTEKFAFGLEKTVEK